MCRLELIVDMGAGNTVIYEKKRGVVISEPSIVAIKRINGKPRVECVGQEALQLARSGKKEDGISFYYPVNNAQIENPEACRLMVKAFLEKLSSKSFIRPTFVVTAVISCGLSQVERKTFESIFTDLGIREVTLIETPIAVIPEINVGCRLVVVAGASVTDVAVVGENGIITGCSISIGGNTLDKLLRQFVYDSYDITISPARAEEARIQLSTLSPDHNEARSIQGTDMVNKSRRSLELTSRDTRAVLIPAIDNLIKTIESVFRLAPSNIQASIQKSGIDFYGGLANTHYIGEYISNALGLPVRTDGNIERVAISCSRFFDNQLALDRMLGVNLGGKK